MNTWRQKVVAVVVVALAGTSAFALPLQVVHTDLPHCDPLFVPSFVHELGVPPTFTPLPDELIDAISTFTQQNACPGDSIETPNALVVITNLTGKAWRDLWYVADPGTAPGAGGTLISNFDGAVDMAPALTLPGDAFKIDTVGINRPLVFESIAFNGIFEVGETWHFIIDDYINFAGLPAHALDSLGVASASAGGPPSSGSIIAVEVPEPASAALLLVAAAPLLRRRR